MDRQPEQQAETMTAIGVNDGRADAPDSGPPGASVEFAKIGAAMVVNLCAAGTFSAASEPAKTSDRTPHVALLTQLPQWARSPDVYAVVLQFADQVIRTRERGMALSPAEITERLSLAWRIDCFPKPMVALIDGPLTDRAMGLTGFGTHRIAGEHYRFAVPALANPDGTLQSIPAAGIAHALARLPHHIGVYLALTGRSIGAADAYAVGLATHVIPASAFKSIIESLADGQPVDPQLDALHREPAAGELSTVTEAIARCFSKDSIAAIRAALAKETGAHQSWAAQTLAALDQRAPIDCAATHRLIRSVRTLGVRDSLILTHRLASRWRSGETLSDVNLDQIFSAADADDLALPSRADIATGRF